MSESWQRFELHTTQQGETTCIALLGEFDVAGVEQLEEELRRAEKEGGRLVLDLRGLKFSVSPGSAIGPSRGWTMLASPGTKGQCSWRYCTSVAVPAAGSTAQAANVHMRS